MISAYAVSIVRVWGDHLAIIKDGNHIRIIQNTSATDSLRIGSSDNLVLEAQDQFGTSHP